MNNNRDSNSGPLPPPGRSVDDQKSPALHSNAQSSNLRSLFRRFNLSHWILLSYPIFLYLIRRQREFEELYVIDKSATIQIIASGLLAIYVGIILLRFLPTFKERLLQRPLIWLLLYILLAISSLVWSIRPDYTLYRGVEVFIFLSLKKKNKIKL